MGSDSEAGEHFGYVMYGPVLTTIGVLGVIGNIISLIVFTRPTMNKSAINTILIALGIFDIMHLGAISINKGMKSFGGLEHSYDFIMYPVTNVIRQFAYTSGIYTMVILTLERYFAICHPEKAKVFNTPSRTKLLIGCVCLFSLTYTSPVFFEFEWSTINDTIKVLRTELRKKDHPTSKVYYQIYRTWMNFFVRFLIPTLFLVITNISIIKKFRNITDLQVRRSGTMITLNARSNEKKLTIMAMVLILVFVICNSFYTIYYPLKYEKVITSAEKQYLYPIACVFVVLNSSVNVVIYGIFDMQFRRVFKSFFKPFLTTREKGDAGRSQKSTSILQYHSNSENVEMVQNVDRIEPSNRTVLV